MRALILVLASLPAWGAAFTTVRTGNWSNTSHTTGPWCNTSTPCTVPGNGDTVTIASNHNLTVDVNTTVGASGDPWMGYVYGIDNSTPHTGCTATCAASIAAGYSTATARCAVVGGSAIVTLFTRGWYAPAATAPAVTVTGTNCGGGAYAAQFQAGNGTPAIQVGNSDGILTIAEDVALTLRGSVTFGRQAGAFMSALVMKRGSTISIDPSVAGANMLYSLGPSNMLVREGIDYSDCTAAKPCTIQTLAGGLPGSISSHYYVTSHWKVKGVYATISNMGDSLTPAIEIAPTAYGAYDVQYTNFVDSGAVTFMGMSAEATAVFRHNHNTHVRSRTSYPSVSALASIRLSFGNAISGSGVREIVGNVFDGALINSGGGTNPFSARDVTITDNYFGSMLYAATASTGNAPWASMTRNFMRAYDNGTNSSRNFVHFNGAASNIYVYADQPVINPHWSGSFYDSNHHVSTSIWEPALSLAGDGGEIIIASANTSNTLDRAIVLPDATGAGSCEFASQAAIANSGMTVTRGTFWGRGGFGAIDADESSAGTTGQYSLLSSILYYPTAASGFYKLMSWGGVGTTGTDVCSPASACDYNAGYNYTSTKTACAQCTNQARGYAAKWSAGAVPGANDIDIVNPDDTSGPGSAPRVNPHFADTLRGVALFDSKYLGNVPSAWANSTSYVAGNTVSVANASYYGGLPVNYRCIAAHTSSTINKPWEGAYTLTGGDVTNIVAAGGVATVNFSGTHVFAAGDTVEVIGADPTNASGGQTLNGAFPVTSTGAGTITYVPVSAPTAGTYTTATITVSPWRKYWEPASLYRLREGVRTQQTITDGAIGCSGCTIVEALLGWVRRGYTPQNLKLWKAAHDGGDVGAVDFGAARVAMLGAIQ